MRAILIAAALASLAVVSVACQVPRDTIDVLYVGHSYVYFNNLPGMVEGISKALEGPIVRGTSHTRGGSTTKTRANAQFRIPLIARMGFRGSRLQIPPINWAHHITLSLE